jgi:prepilin-type N-terminal cleavage/methylation domain-containing protein
MGRAGAPECRFSALLARFPAMPKLQLRGDGAPRRGHVMRLPPHSEQPQRTSGHERGFTIIEILMVLLIVGVLSAILIPVFASAILRANRTALAADGRSLYSAFTKYYVDQGYFPSTSTPLARAFNLTNLAPLSNNGYYSNPTSLTRKLLSNRVTAYDSPNTGGSDTQFWAVLTHKSDSRVVVLVASTDQYPGHVGTPFEGVYFIQGSSIVQVSPTTAGG